MATLPIYSIILLVFIIATQRASRLSIIRLRWIAFIVISGIFALLCYLTALQYFTWAGGNIVTRHLLPPYQGIGYFILYAFTEFWADHLLAAALGLIGYLIIRRHAKQTDPFFYPEEPLLCLLTFLLVGHPLWIFFGIALLLATLAGTLWTRFVTKTNNRISFRYLWLPLAALTLAASPILNKLDFVIYLHL